VKTTETRPDTDAMAKVIVDGRKDDLLVDFARLISVHYGKMVEKFSDLEGSPVSAHNNKTLFLEAIDLWCRATFTRKTGGRPTENPRDIIEWVMEPYYEALELEDPSQYRARSRGDQPAYSGDPDAATAIALALCACLDIQPIRIRLGIQAGEPVRAWGRVYADGKWYDTDVNDPALALGEHQEFEDYKEMEVPLEMEEEA
jgi:hypothetical protein